MGMGTPPAGPDGTLGRRRRATTKAVTALLLVAGAAMGAACTAGTEVSSGSTGSVVGSVPGSAPDGSTPGTRVRGTTGATGTAVPRTSPTTSGTDGTDDPGSTLGGPVDDGPTTTVRPTTSTRPSTATTDSGNSTTTIAFSCDGDTLTYAALTDVEFDGVDCTAAGYVIHEVRLRTHEGTVWVQNWRCEEGDAGAWACVRGSAHVRWREP